MPSNREIVRTVITTTDQGTHGAGLLSKEQMYAIYVLAEVNNPWMSMQNLERRKSHSGGVPRIDFGDDVIRPATEAVNSGYFAKPTYDNVPYVQKKGRTAFKVSMEGIDQSADPDHENKLIDGFTASWGRSHQRLAWMGDEASADPMLLLNDGWAKDMQANGNPVDGSAIQAGALSIDHFHAAIQSLPEAWKQRLAELKWGMTMGQWFNYIETLGPRATALGDLAMEEGPSKRKTILGIEVVPVPSLTEPLNKDRLILSKPKNTTVVMSPNEFSLQKVNTGVTAVSEDVTYWIGFFYSDYILLEVEGTSIVYNLNN